MIKINFFKCFKLLQGIQIAQNSNREAMVHLKQPLSRQRETKEHHGAAIMYGAMEKPWCKTVTPEKLQSSLKAVKGQAVRQHKGKV